MMHYNFGCGYGKIKDAINVDINPAVNPDKVMDIRGPLDIETVSCDLVTCYHTIEHIEAIHHPRIFAEFRRILKEGGRVILSYPEFVRCAKNYIDNYLGKREFWAATIFGRQARPDDYHLALMDSRDVANQFRDVGFSNIEFKQEDGMESHNTVVTAIVGKIPPTYEQVLAKTIFND